MSQDKTGLKIEYLPDDEGVKVNGKWYASLSAYFEDREEEIKGSGKSCKRC